MKPLSFLLVLAMVMTLIVSRPLNGAAQSSQQNSDARKLFIEGRDLQDDGKFSDAEKKFREALTKYPKADQSDRTAYYLIATLVKLGRATDARGEIESFRKNYPQSSWRSDVEEKSLTLGGTATPFGYYVHSTDGERRIDALNNLHPLRLEDFTRLYNAWPQGTNWTATPFSTFILGGNASLESEILRLILERDAERGIEVARERLKANPADPAVISNLSTIANSSSAQALPFLMTLMTSPTANPNAKSQAFFWASRKSGDKDQMAKALMDLLGGPQGKEGESAVADVLQRFSSVERRNALDQIAQSQNAERLTMLERIFRAGSSPVRIDIVRSVAQIVGSTSSSSQTPRALAFLTDAAQNDKDSNVRRAAIQALTARKDLDVKTLETLLKAIPAPPAAPTPVK